MPGTFEELSDLCFIAAAECREGLKQLEPLSPTSQPLTVLVVMERSQSRLSNGLCAVETRLARMYGRDSQTCHVDLGRKSLRARWLIARFRRRMASVVQQAGDDTEKKIRSIGNSFAWLLGHDQVANLRASDRLTAKMLHQRILDWLSSSASTDDDGRRLCHDVTVFVEFLRLINCREEIVQHDSKVVLEVLSVLADSDPDGPLPSSIIERLESIQGRDDLLDDMLGVDVGTAGLRSRLLKVFGMLEREGAPSADLGSGPLAGHLGRIGLDRRRPAAGRLPPGAPDVAAGAPRQKP